MTSLCSFFLFWKSCFLRWKCENPCNVWASDERPKVVYQRVAAPWCAEAWVVALTYFWLTDQNISSGVLLKLSNTLFHTTQHKTLISWWNQIDCLASRLILIVLMWLCVLLKLLCWQRRVVEIQSGRCGRDCREKSPVCHCSHLAHNCYNANIAEMWLHVVVRFNSFTLHVHHKNILSTFQCSEQWPNMHQLVCVSLLWPMPSDIMSRSYCNWGGSWESQKRRPYAVTIWPCFVSRQRGRDEICGC